MKLYKARTGGPNQQLFRVLGYGAIAVLLGILFFSLYEPEGVSDPMRHMIGWVTVAIVLLSVVGAYVLSAKEGILKVKSASEWELTGEKIIQRQKDGTAIEIPLAQIESLHQYRGWLIIRGGEPIRQVAVPQEINDFEEVKRELGTYRAITPLVVKVSPFSFLPLVLLIAVCVLLFTSHDRPVVMVAGAALLVLQGLGSYALLRRSGNIFRPKLVILHILLWLLIAWVVYQRVTTVM